MLHRCCGGPTGEQRDGQVSWQASQTSAAATHRCPGVPSWFPALGRLAGWATDGDHVMVRLELQHRPAWPITLQPRTETRHSKKQQRPWSAYPKEHLHPNARQVGAWFSTLHFPSCSATPIRQVRHSRPTAFAVLKINPTTVKCQRQDNILNIEERRKFTLDNTKALQIFILCK